MKYIYNTSEGHAQFFGHIAAVSCVPPADEFEKSVD